MEKAKAKGVIILGIISILISLCVLLLKADAMISPVALLKNTKFPFIAFIGFIGTISYLSLITGCIGSFLYKNWARILIILSSVILLIYYPIVHLWQAILIMNKNGSDNLINLIISRIIVITIPFRIVIFGLNIFYFSRLNVKQKFKQ